MKIMIVDDHVIVREGLRALLDKQADIEVVGEAENGESAVERQKELLPDVVITDITMPKLNGVEAIRRIHACDPMVKIIALSMHAENSIVTEALKAGCHGYVLKSASFDEILAALEAVSQNERYLSPEITAVVIDEFLHAGPGHNGTGIELLTGRERQVLQRVAEGYAIKEIARDLHVSPKTIDTTRRKIMHKLNEHSVAGLTKFAVREGLTALEF